MLVGSMNLYRAVRRGTVFKTIMGKEPFYWTGRNSAVREFGSKYGRWGIHTAGLSASSTIVSFGLGEDVSFESELIARFGCKVYGFDPTPSSVQYIAQNVTNPRFEAHAYALSDHDGFVTFAPPPGSAADQVSASAVADYAASSTKGVRVPCLTLESARRRFNIGSVDVLKMDIEGAEYAVLAQALEYQWLDQVSQVLVEFHHFLPGLEAAQTKRAVADMARAGFRIAWVGRTNHEYLFTRGSVAAD